MKGHPIYIVMGKGRRRWVDDIWVVCWRTTRQEADAIVEVCRAQRQAVMKLKRRRGTPAFINQNHLDTPIFDHRATALGIYTHSVTYKVVEVFDDAGNS